MREMRHTVSKFKESLSEVVDGERRKPRRDSAETSIGVFVAEADELSSVPERRSSSAKGATPQKDASSKKHASRTRREKAEKEKAQREEVYNAVREGLGDDFEVSARRAAATGNFDL
ncbi:unnamed protein product [Prorocentrum cordatum]|uniref:Uncharacterized protein n=1 Tax=Prorocentrum cordatum TaxID=2364126 RepID=A0ABN9PMD7_9DINO|nr:unnamed protein product [Polarella glacialis]